MSDRINKFLSARGVCSRREADRLVEAGRVTINGRQAQLGDTVGPDDEIEVNGQLISGCPESVYVMVNKPVGIITTTDRSKKDNILDLVNRPERLYPVGRLDVESSGLLLLTNDGGFANRMSHPRYEHEKEYLVTADREVKDGELKRLSDGLHLEDGPAKATKVRRVSPRAFVMTITEGRNRQVRRMCEALEMKVVRLKRTRVHNLMLGALKPGQSRELTKTEISRLKARGGGAEGRRGGAQSRKLKAGKGRKNAKRRKL